LVGVEEPEVGFEVSDEGNVVDAMLVEIAAGRMLLMLLGLLKYADWETDYRL